MPHDTDGVDVHRQPFAKVNETLRLRTGRRMQARRTAVHGNNDGAMRMHAGVNGRRITLALAVTVLGMMWLGPAAAQDVLKVAPDAYRKLIENAHMRVLEANLKPGAKIALHSHPEHLLYLLTDGTLVIKIQGKTPYEMTFKVGDAFLLPAQTRATENNGEKPVRMLVVELKTGAAKPASRPHRPRRGAKPQR
jgi:quercetin dioxygenase-like cupin family protein